MLPDWQLPPGVDRGLWDYLRAADMVAGYDAQMAASPLARTDVAFCERAFPTPGRLIDLGCGTGRLCVHFAAKGYDCLGVDLSEPMLAQARANAAGSPEPPNPPGPPSLSGKGGDAPTDWQTDRSTPTSSQDVAPRKHPSPSGGGVDSDNPSSSSVADRPGTATFRVGNLVELGDLPDGSFDYAACLFSTLGMVRGSENRAKLVTNAFRLLKPGGRFVLHVHNRFFRGLGRGVVWRQRWRTLLGRADAGDVTMPQAYGGAPLTLHHFTRRGAVRLLEGAGFRVIEVAPVGLDGAPAREAYGYLFLAERGRVSAPCDGAAVHV